MRFDGSLGGGIQSAAREAEYSARVKLFGECTTRKMTDEEKARYGLMSGSGDKETTAGVVQMTRENRGKPRAKTQNQETGGAETSSGKAAADKDGYSKAKAAEIMELLLNAEFDKGYLAGFEAGKQEAAKVLYEALKQMGAKAQ